jgi:hypothetical protein
MTTFPTVDSSRTRLHQAGWSIGEIATATRWIITGATQAEAWHRAVEQAEAVGMAGEPNAGFAPRCRPGR